MNHEVVKEFLLVSQPALAISQADLTVLLVVFRHYLML